jgi:2-polyprenyl-6-methoxyphenol hydroxylase-like FAD-dependent oxidoreductase
VVERFDEFRSGGQNVDVRGAAHEVIARMNVTEQIKANNTSEEGTSYIGGRGQLLGGIPAEQEQDGPTAELEILRGDLAKVILDALPSDVTVRYGDRVASATNRGEVVDVTFMSERTGSYDLVVIAEGVRSKTRDLVFGPAVDKRELGLNMAYGTIPRIPTDDKWWRWYVAPGRRGITLRPDNVGTTRATLAYLDRGSSINELTPARAKAELARIFTGAGWQADRVVRGFAESDDVYMDALTQIRMPSWGQGKIIVTGDAAWCVTPLGGGGTSLALVGGYVLAAFLSQSDSCSFEAAIGRYEQWMRPFIAKVQDLPRGIPALFYPRTRAGVAVLRTIWRTLSARPFRSLGASFARVAKANQDLPAIRLSPAHS